VPRKSRSHVEVSELAHDRCPLGLVEDSGELPGVALGIVNQLELSTV
jgi:hypothetical protein